MSTGTAPKSQARAYRWLAATHSVIARGADAASRQPSWHEQGARTRLRALATAMRPDGPAARGHADRVAMLCRRLALSMGLTTDEAEIVALAGQLHDVGATSAALAVGRADPEYRRHPAIGAQLVVPFDVLGLAAPMIRHHHERSDGSGYPDGLRGDAIPLGARIIAVADEYDRLVCRSETAPLAHGAALDALAERGGVLDAIVIAALIDLPLP